MKTQPELAPLAGGELSAVERARAILHGPCQCGSHKRPAEPFCGPCMKRLKRLSLRLYRAVDEIEMAEPFLRFYSLALAELKRPQTGAEAEAAGRAAYESDASGPQAAQAPKVGKS